MRSTRRMEELGLPDRCFEEGFRCRKDVAHIRQPCPDSGLIFHANVLQTCVLSPRFLVLPSRESAERWAGASASFYAGTYETVKARFWIWRSVQVLTAFQIFPCSLGNGSDLTNSRLAEFKKVVKFVQRFCTHRFEFCGAHAILSICQCGKLRTAQSFQYILECGLFRLSQN